MLVLVMFFRFDDSVWREWSSSLDGFEGGQYKGIYLPEMAHQEVFSLEDLDDAFVLAQAEKDASVEDLIKNLDTAQTHV